MLEMSEGRGRQHMHESKRINGNFLPLHAHTVLLSIDSSRERTIALSNGGHHMHYYPHDTKSASIYVITKENIAIIFFYIL